LRISLSTASLYFYPLRHIFALARDAGFDGLELVLGPGAIPEDSSRIKELSREYGLPILTIHPPMIPMPGRREHHRLLPVLARVAHQLDSQFIVIHVPKALSLSEGIGKEYVAAVGACVGQLRGGSPRLCLENQAVFRTEDRRYILSTPQKLGCFAQEHDVAVTLDTAHAASFPCDLLEAYEALASRLVNVHFSDFRRDLSIPPWFNLHSHFKHHQMPGQGDLALVPFLERLKRDSYDGIITVEVSPFSLEAWHPGRVRANLRRCVDFVRGATD
jgi:sugar phosphate isomerase/epimerase